MTEQKPVAWIVHDRVAPDRLTFVEVKQSLQTEVTPLYTSPPYVPMERQRQWLGLTDEEIVRIWKPHMKDGTLEFAHAIETKLKEKNT